ncbi:MAG: hypothetical protein JO061_16475 [Acidobacteriaceae bacterium]|nr:hypothetical protein [Acidobacteriaceae bacterium]
MKSLVRIGAWAGAFAFSTTLFSLLCCFRGSFRSFTFIVLVTTKVAFPAWVLFIPFIVGFKHLEGRRLWIILSAGTLIGPLYLLVVGVISQLGRGDVQTIWQGDGIGLGIFGVLPIALGISFVTTALYLLAMKTISYRPSTRAA